MKRDFAMFGFGCVVTLASALFAVLLFPLNKDSYDFYPSSYDYSYGYDVYDFGKSIKRETPENQIALREVWNELQKMKEEDLRFLVSEGDPCLWTELLNCRALPPSKIKAKMQDARELKKSIVDDKRASRAEIISGLSAMFSLLAVVLSFLMFRIKLAAHSPTPPTS